jgi:protein O-mannosyl-transferase
MGPNPIDNREGAETRPDARPATLKAIGLCAVLIIIIGATGYLFYESTIAYKLVFSDDNIFVIDYSNFNKDISNIPTSFKQTIGKSFYRPLLITSFIIDSHMSKSDNRTNPYIYRRTNVLLHAIASCLVFIALIKLKYEHKSSFVISMLFTVHPLLTPAASWISGRNDSLVTIFILLSFIAVIGFYNNNKYNKWIYYTFCIITFACSLFTKEVSIMLPFVVLAYSYLYRKDPVVTTKNIVVVIGYVIIVTLWLVMRSAAFSNVVNPDSIGLESFVRNVPSMPAMIGKMFLPIEMIALSSYEPTSIVSGVVIILGLIALVCFSEKIDKRRILFGVLWTIFFILPALVVRIVGVDDFFDYAEHRSYLAMIGIFIIIMELIKNYNIDFRKPIPVFASIIIISLYGYRAWIYKPVFENRTTFWRHAVEMYPSKVRGLLNLGKAYVLDNDLDSAEECYKRGIELDSQNVNLYIGIVDVYIKKKEFEKAIKYCKIAIEIESTNVTANYYLAKSYINLNNYAEAIVPLKRAYMYNSDPLWLNDLAFAYYKSGNARMALDTYTNLLEMYPNIAIVYANIGLVYAELGDYPNAEKSWRKAVELDAKMYDSYNNLIKLYILTNNQDKAFEIKDKLEQAGGKLDPMISVNETAGMDQPLSK